ncbi:Amino acid transporter [Operophtera brumata]|uniref:Amino acid transporter n=1 Tax=Operophtera brumata TaxID=104452 RepID=A0A0L7KZL1_OPEBR|nr:Amino acid transporter [Operophtera brumata]
MSAKVLVAIAVFFTYCLQMYAPMDILWTRIKGRVGQPYHNLGQVALRTASVIFTGEFLLVSPITVLPPNVRAHGHPVDAD